MGVRLFVMERSYVVWLVFHYEMPELGSNSLVLGIRTLSVEPHCSALMCLDSLRLPSCARNPHKYFSYNHCMNCFVKWHRHGFKEITTAHTHVDSLSISLERSGAPRATECREARRCPTQPQLT
ncbi:hypothetical protein M9H77_08336 [Catharanthus roseus]|uniref:Uncharacterized protein n=1 Tax=Catharanthus roseus TaxID=4058 RepID=A0ACC0BXH2_CATRO|nr:hypothetical protein M9H77_08336 [Catharanthus roseus]